ncbi:MAG TPA: hypothetical protein VGV38_16825 [Pyrinomonadaceae bacterium]|nr:hypothetical protein [Pyrinomonadaceae bacterium]
MFATARTAYARPAPHAFAPAPARTDDANARLNWLVAFHAHDERQRLRFRDVREREEMELMSRPRDARQTYKLLGALLGLLPPAAIFYRMFGDWIERQPNVLSAFGFFALLVLMNLVCWLVGRWLGSKLGARIEEAERGSWLKTLMVAALLGFVWAALTGFLGGLLFFGIGAIFGAFCAVPVGVAGFTVFTIFHRPLARGGMIDARHLRPLAWGVTLTIAAMILGVQ